MTEFTHGLLIGKFYPLHNGHVALIERAAARCEHLTVIVMASQLESIPLTDRVNWTRESTRHLGNVSVLGIVDDAPVDYRSEIAWVAHVESMRAALRLANAAQVTAVFGGEDYANELASRFGAVAVFDDRERQLVPMSGTAARADLAGNWMNLPPATRLGLATRIILVGAESTGTTFLTTALLERYRARFPAIAPVEEYGRTFTYELARQTGGGMDDLVWTTEHFAHIAARQTENENAAALACPLVIADTDAFATSIWERRYVGDDSHGAAHAAGPALPRHDLYFVTDHVGVPFVQDGWRDGESIRSTMTGWFVDGLTARALPWVLLRGSHEERLAYAIQAIDSLLDRRLTFS
jgi:HTH-type transcriptional regulator, transcriptional repressor of NAD biosynthesis genes